MIYHAGQTNSNNSQWGYCESNYAMAIKESCARRSYLLRLCVDFNTQYRYITAILVDWVYARCRNETSTTQPNFISVIVAHSWKKLA